jgi:hypothetical protein
MPAGFLLLAALGLASQGEGAAKAASPPPVATYELVEASESLTPRGKRSTALGGIVTVREGLARWDLTHGTFPRSRASSLVAEPGGVTLLDRSEKLAASASEADFLALFQGRTADPGAAASKESDVKVTVRTDGRGRPFEDKPTTRFRLEAAWTVVHSTPGQITRVKVEATGWFETVELPAAASPLDAFGRLLPARGTAREALVTELAKISGVPVFVEIAISSSSSTEAPGMQSGTSPPPKPLTASSTVTRRVRNLHVRPGEAGDEALVAVPVDYHSRGLERLLIERDVP